MRIGECHECHEQFNQCITKPDCSHILQCVSMKSPSLYNPKSLLNLYPYQENIASAVSQCYEATPGWLFFQKVINCYSSTNCPMDWGYDMSENPRQVNLLGETATQRILFSHYDVVATLQVRSIKA